MKLGGMTALGHSPVGEEDDGARHGPRRVKQEGLARYKGPTGEEGRLADSVYSLQYTCEGKAVDFLH